MIKPLSRIKQLVVPAGRKPRIVQMGIFRGLRLNLDLRTQSQVYLGLFEREVYNWLQKHTRDIHTAVDIGAADGEYTLYFLARTPARRVIACEPSSVMRPHLSNNLALNRLEYSSRVVLLSQYVGNNGLGEISMDTLLPLIEPPVLVKVDIDGGELNLLQGATRLLQMPQVHWLIETHSRQLEVDCIDLLRDAGYEVRVLPNAWWRIVLPEQRSVMHNRWLVATRTALS